MITQQMAELRERIRALKAEYALLVEQKKKLANRKHNCSTIGCLNLTSKKTTLAKWGEHYKQCDECRENARRRAILRA